MSQRTRDRRRSRTATGARPADLGPTPPATMWPEPGSGYEANPFSPAGQMQQQWRFYQGLARRGWGRIVLRVLAVALVLPVLFQLLALVG